MRSRTLDEPSPPLRDLNGTYHLFATRRHAAAVNKGAVIVHFESSDGAEWTGGEVVLSPSDSGWDSGGCRLASAPFPPARCENTSALRRRDCKRSPAAAARGDTRKTLLHAHEQPGTGLLAVSWRTYTQ